MSTPNVLVLDGLSNEGVEILKAGGFNVDVKPPQKPEELAAIIGAYDALVVRSGTKVTAEALAKADRLKVIGRAGVGVDNIDQAAATEKGIVVMNTPGGNTISTCEHTFALMMALCRNIPALTPRCRRAAGTARNSWAPSSAARPLGSSVWDVSAAPSQNARRLLR